MMRKKTKQVQIGNMNIGGDAPVSVQSMTNTDTRDIDATVAQIERLTEAGCDIVRSSVYDMTCVAALRSIHDRIRIPLVADIHFDYRLAIAAMENGADKLRFNPGNIGDENRVRAVVACAKMHNTPIRIGVNAGSIEPALKKKYGGATPEAMIESALKHVRILESEHFDNIVVSMKASTVEDTVNAYRRVSDMVDYPLHIGITETGSVEEGIVKSAIGLGALLLDGIGDTMRVSLTDDPVREVETANRILRALHLKKDDIEIISCPTCGRTRVNLMKMVDILQERLPRRQGYLKVAVMGCAVNGPGEASDADIGIAFGNGNGVLFEKGLKVGAGQSDEIMEQLIHRVEDILREKH